LENIRFAVSAVFVWRSPIGKHLKEREGRIHFVALCRSCLLVVLLDFGWRGTLLATDAYSRVFCVALLLLFGKQQIRGFSCKSLVSYHSFVGCDVRACHCFSHSVFGTLPFSSEVLRNIWSPRQREFRIGCADSDSPESPFPNWMTVGLGFAWYEVGSHSI
jgi:hypothetical protein